MYKKNTTLRVIASVLATLLLCAVILVIIFFGEGSKSNFANGGKYGKDDLPSTGTNYFLDDKSKIELPQAETFIIEIPFGAVNILNTDEEKPYVKISGETVNFTKNLYLNVAQPNADKCIIKFDFKGFGRDFFDGFNLEGFEQKINIYLPKKLDKLDVSIDAGTVDITDISAMELDLSLDAGKCNVTDCDFERIETDVNAGNLSIEIDDAMEVTAEVDVGNLNMYIPKDTNGFVLKYKTSLGNFADKTGLDVNFDPLKKDEGLSLNNGGVITYGKGNKGARIDVSVEIGNVSLYTY